LQALNQVLDNAEAHFKTDLTLWSGSGAVASLATQEIIKKAFKATINSNPVSAGIFFVVDAGKSLVDLGRPHEVEATLDAARDAGWVTDRAMHAVVVQVGGSTEQDVIAFPTFYTHERNAADAARQSASG